MDARFFYTVIMFTTLTVGLGALSYKINQLEIILAEMNNRQKSVVVTQHKAIEDQIIETCKR